MQNDDSHCDTTLDNVLSSVDIERSVAVEVVWGEICTKSDARVVYYALAGM